MDRPLRRRPRLRPDGPRPPRARARARHGRAPRRDRRHRREPRAAELREHDRRDGARRGGDRPRVHVLRHLELEPVLAGVPRDPAAHGAEALRVLLEDHPERSPLRARRRRLRAAARPRPPARPGPPRRARLRRVRPQRRHARRRREGALRRDQPAPRRAPHAVLEQRPRRRRELRALPLRGPALRPAGVVCEGGRSGG